MCIVLQSNYPVIDVVHHQAYINMLTSLDDLLIAPVYCVLKRDMIGCYVYEYLSDRLAWKHVGKLDVSLKRKFPISK